MGQKLGSIRGFAHAHPNRDNALYTFGYTEPWLWRAITVI